MHYAGIGVNFGKLLGNHPRTFEPLKYKEFIYRKRITITKHRDNIYVLQALKLPYTHTPSPQGFATHDIFSYQNCLEISLEEA